jgi:quinol monooxygenase YgiN
MHTKPEANMIKVVAKVTLKPEHIETFKSLVPELVAETRKEEGCIAYQLLNDVNEAHVFAFIEEWENDARLQAHMNSAHFKTIFPQIAALLEKDPEVSVMTLVI